MKTMNQGVGARFVRSGIMAVCLLLAPWASRAEQPGQPGQRSLLPTVVTCALGAVSTSFTPGLRNDAARPVAVASESAYDTCVTLFGEPVSAATTFEQRSLTGQGCGLLRTGQPSRLVVNWDTGEHSALALSLHAVDVQGLITIETYNGTVTEGKYQGAHAVRTVTYFSADFAGGCMSVRGLTEAQGFTNLVLTLM